MRAIDADALKEQIRKGLGIKSFKYLLPAEKYIVDKIDRMTTIQPEQRTGEYVHVSGYSDQYKCTACGIDIVPMRVVKFCPECGAKILKMTSGNRIRYPWKGDAE